jgi:hypothetical protein
MMPASETLRNAADNLMRLVGIVAETRWVAAIANPHRTESIASVGPRRDTPASVEFGDQTWAWWRRHQRSFDSPVEVGLDSFLGLPRRCTVPGFIVRKLFDGPDDFQIDRSRASGTPRRINCLHVPAIL